MKRIANFAFVLLLPLAAWAGSVVPYGTYLVKGSFRGDYNTVLTGSETATLRAQRPDGTVIAETTVRTADTEGVNFVLSIPVASESVAKACAVGETLDCTLFTDEWSVSLPGALTVGPPIHVGWLTINYTDVRTYTNPADGTVVDIPAEYIAEAQAYLDDDDELKGKTYDPWADYDGDGVSNYGEYLAGTHPFDPSDVLRITDFRQMGEQFSLSFEHVGGHVYAVSSANTLAQPEWAARRVRKSAEGATLDQVLADGNEGDPGMTTIYITPLAGATSEFFRVEPK